MKSIDISIIIPIYNTEQYLSQCIDSVLCDQNIEEMEVILINDGSTDRSGFIADEYAKISPKIKVFHQTNQGIWAARNKGLSEASGKYIAFLDSDDWLMKNALSSLYIVTKKYQLDMVMGHVLYYYSENNIQRHFNNIPQNIIGKNISGKDAFLNLMRCLSFPPLVYNYIYKRSWLEKINMKFENILHEDELWTLTSICQANSVYITDINIYYYRFRRENSFMTSLNNDDDKIKQRISSLFFIVEKFFDFAEQFNKKTDVEIKGWIYLKLLQMYHIACELLATTKNVQSFFQYIPDISSLLDFESLPNKVQKKLCLYYYTRSILEINKISTT